MSYKHAVNSLSFLIVYAPWNISSCVKSGCPWVNQLMGRVNSDCERSWEGFSKCVWNWWERDVSFVVFSRKKKTLYHL